MSEAEGNQDALWPRGWSGHRKAQLRYWAKLPLYEKLAWFEEAHRLVIQLGKQQKGKLRLDPVEKAKQEENPMIE